MADQAATSNSNIQVSVQVQYSVTNLKDAKDDLLKTIEGELSGLKINKQLYVELTNLKFSKGAAKSSLNKSITELRNSIIQKLGAVGNSPIELKNLRIKTDPKGFQNVGKNVANTIGKSIESALNNLQINLNGKGINANNFINTLKGQITQLVQQLQTVANNAQASATNKVIDPNTIFTTRNKVRKKSSFSEYKQYMLQEAKEIEAAGKQLEAAIRKVQGLDPNLASTTTARNDLARLKQAYDDRVALFQKRGRLNANAFSGQDFTAINQALLQSGSAASTAAAKYDQMQRSFGNINSSAKSARDAINLLNQAFQAAQTAQSKFDKVANNKNLSSSTAQKLVAQGKAEQLKAQQLLDQYNTTYKNTGKYAGFSTSDKQQVSALVNATNNALKSGARDLNTYENHIKKLATAFNNLGKDISKAISSLKNFAKSGNTDAQNMINQLKQAQGQVNQRLSQNRLSTSAYDSLVRTADQGTLLSANMKTLQSDFSTRIIEQAERVKQAYKEISTLSKELNKAPVGSTQFKDLASQLTAATQKAQVLEAELNRLNNVLASKNINATKPAVNAINKASAAKTSALAATGGATKADLANISKASNAYALLEKHLASYAKATSKLGSMKVDTGPYNAQLDVISKLEDKIKKIQEYWNRTKNTFSTKIPGVQSLIGDFDKLGIKIQTVAQQAKNFGPDTMRSFESLKKLLLEINRTQSGLNSKQSAAYGSQVDQLARQVQAQINAGPSAETTRIAGQMQGQWDNLRTSIANAGKESLTFGQNLSSAFRQFSSYFSVTIMVMEVIQQLKQMIEYTKQLDTAMTELRKVTDLSENTYSTFLDTAGQKAVELGSTLTDVVTTVGDFSRLGYNLDEALQLGEAAIKLKNVGDGIDSISDASEKIISAMKGFNIPVENVSSIVDKYNEVGRNVLPIQIGRRLWTYLLVNSYNG